MVCLRVTESDMWGVDTVSLDVWSKDPSKEEQFRSSPTLFTGKPKEIAIFLSRDARCPPLRASVQAYRWNDEKDDSKVEKAAFVRELVPSHQSLIQWVERQIELENRADFQSAIRRFLMAYSHEGIGLPRVRHGIFPHQDHQLTKCSTRS